MKLQFQCEKCDETITVSGQDEESCMDSAEAEGWRVGARHRDRDFCPRHAGEVFDKEFERASTHVGVFNQEEGYAQFLRTLAGSLGQDLSHNSPMLDKIADWIDEQTK